MIENEAILPIQYDAQAPISGEAKLCLAILEEAAHSLLKYRGMKGRHVERIYKEAWEFFASEENFVCSFEFCCELVGLNAEWLRRKLLDGHAVPRVEHYPRRRFLAHL